MRLPFLQVAQETLTKARMLGRYARIAEAHALGVAVMLDAYAVEMLAGDGFLKDPNPSEELAAACGWEGDAEALLAALLRARIVEQDTERGIRIPSRARYEAALAGQTNRSEKARAAATERWERKRNAPSNASASREQCASDAKTQTQTQTQKEETSSAGSTPPADGKQPVLIAVPPAEPEKPKKRPTVPNAVSEWFEAAKTKRLGLVPATAPDNSALRPDQWARLGEALKAHGQKAMEGALAVFFADGYARDRHFPLGLFVGQWEKYLGEANALAAKVSPAEDARARLARESREKYERERAAKRAAGGAA